MKMSSTIVERKNKLKISLCSHTPATLTKARLESASAAPYSQLVVSLLSDCVSSYRASESEEEGASEEGASAIQKACLSDLSACVRKVSMECGHDDNFAAELFLSGLLTAMKGAVGALESALMRSLSSCDLPSETVADSALNEAYGVIALSRATSGRFPSLPALHVVPDGEGAAQEVYVSRTLMRQESQKDVGFGTWPGGYLMSLYLLHEREALFGCKSSPSSSSSSSSSSPGRAAAVKTVLEIGSGTGLAGFTACKLLSARGDYSVSLSDFNGECVRNLKKNAAINCCDDARVFELDFSRRQASSYDVIIGADVICNDDDSRSLSASLRDLLKPGTGVAHIITGDGECRYGVDKFKSDVQGAGGSVLTETFDVEAFMDRIGVAKGDRDVVRDEIAKCQAYVDGMGFYLHRVTFN